MTRGLALLRVTVSAFLTLTMFAAPVAGDGFIDDWIQGFADSEIVFQRAKTNVPFLPLAYVDVSYYKDTEVRRPEQSSLQYDLSSVSQAAVLPFLTSPRDVLVVGEWIRLSRFEGDGSESESFDALSFGIPLGWFSQTSDDYQAAAFVMPLAHQADLDGADMSQETIGGVFGRYMQRDNLHWVYGFYFDVGEGDDLYLPYLGASWDIDNEITLSAILPWPAVLYAPTENSLYRFGARPSGAAWSLNPDQGEIYYDLDTWNLGIAAEYRLGGNFWLAFEVGVAGLRSLSLSGGDWQGASFDIDESPYLTLAINFRPAPPRTSVR